jgi:uncharacterized protein (DUF1697 family)
LPGRQKISFTVQGRNPFNDQSGFMNTYIALLRGINVSGRNLIRMEPLRESLRELGYSGVTTYLQSGNVVFSADLSGTEMLERQISLKIREDFSCEVPVIVLNPERLMTILANNPFARQPGKNPDHLYVTLLSTLPDRPDLPGLEARRQPGEEISIMENVVYLYCPVGYGKTRLSNTFLESKLGVTATTRNWKTINELSRLAV